MSKNASASMCPQHTPGIGWLAVTVLLLCAAPRLGLKLGPLPIYAIDAPALMAFVSALRLPARSLPTPSFASLVQLLVVFIVAGELAAIVYFGNAIFPAYALMRVLIAVSVFYAAAQLIRTPDDLLLLIKVAAVGMLVTAALMIVSSLPWTRAVAADYIFSNPLLEPAAEETASFYASEAVAEQGVRGRSLVGVSILSGTFINILLPLALMLYSWRGTIGIWRKVALMACLLAPLGVLVSYSRGAILGLALVICGIVALGAKRASGLAIAAIGATAILLLSLGLQSDVFMFDRVGNRTQAIFDNPYEDERESERLLAYVEPFAHVLEHPQFLFLGEGSIAQRFGLQASQFGAATHAIFAKGYYSYGMIAGILYMIIPWFLYRRLTLLRRYARRQHLAFLEHYANSLLIVLVALLPWLVFGHAAITEARGAMMLFLVIGLVASTRNFLPAQRLAVSQAGVAAAIPRPAG